MKKSTLRFLLATIIYFTTNAAIAQNFEWAKSFGGTSGSGISGDFGYSIAVDFSGNVYTTGHFLGTVDFDPGAGVFNLSSAGGWDIFIQKLDNSGNFLWAKSFGGTANDQGLSITVDASGTVYTTGRFGSTVDFDPGVSIFNLSSPGNDNVFIQKLDNSGNFLWAKSFGGSTNDQGLSIAIDASENVYTTGYFSGTVDFDPGVSNFSLSSAGNDDVFIQKLNNSGDFQWAKSFGGTSNDQGLSISVDASGNVYSTGRFGSTVDFDPGASTFNLSSTGNDDVFILKLNDSGNFQWATSFGGSFNDQGLSIAVDNSGNVYSTGYFRGTVDVDPGAGTFNLSSAANEDVFVLKLGNSGNFLWAKSFVGSANDRSVSIAIDISGNIYTTGNFEGTIDFDPSAGNFNLSSLSTNAFVQKMDASGNFLWVKSFSGSANSTNCIVVDLSGNLYSTGYFVGTVDFDPGAGTFNRNSAGNSDVFVQKMSQCTPNTGTDIISACDSYTWIDGITYTASNNIATHTLTNSLGCDSVITLNLTINAASGTTTNVITACGSYTWIDGITYTASNNIATYTLTNSVGCDSIITLNLTINVVSDTTTNVITTCGSYTWIDGITYTASNNIATHTLTNAVGCDSVITLNLTINSPSDITTTTNELTITANNIGAIYQWLDCDNNYAEISGETSVAFTAVANGSYAVEITENGCLDTSDCVAIITVAIIEDDFRKQVSVFPNPTEKEFTLQIPENGSLVIYDLMGKIVLKKQVTIIQKIEVSHLAKGLYNLQVSTTKGNVLKKLAIE